MKIDDLISGLLDEPMEQEGNSIVFTSRATELILLRKMRTGYRLEW